MREVQRDRKENHEKFLNRYIFKIKNKNKKYKINIIKGLKLYSASNGIYAARMASNESANISRKHVESLSPRATDTTTDFCRLTIDWPWPGRKLGPL